MDLKPLFTTIEKTIQTYLGEIVLENPKGFPRMATNIYLVTSQGKIFWKAEKPEETTLFSRVKLNEDGKTFSAYTVGNHACDLDLETGKLLGFTTLK